MILMLHEERYSWLHTYYKRFSIPGCKFIIKDFVHYQEILYAGETHIGQHHRFENSGHCS